MIARDPFAALEALAACPDIHDLGDLLGEARRAAPELYALKIGEKRDPSTRDLRIMYRVESYRVFPDPRAARALEMMEELFARLM